MGVVATSGGRKSVSVLDLLSNISADTGRVNTNSVLHKLLSNLNLIP